MSIEITRIAGSDLARHGARPQAGASQPSRLLVLSCLLLALTACAPTPSKHSARPSSTPVTAAPAAPPPPMAPTPAPIAPAPVVVPPPPVQAPPAPPAPAAPAPKPVAPKAPTANASVKPAPAAVPPPQKPIEPTPVVAATDASIKGHIELVGNAGEAIVPSDLADTTVYFVPDAGAPKPKPGHYSIYTRGKQFEPSALAIPVGSTISFPNQDQILHNVFAVSPAANFDLGLYGEGGSGDYTFKAPGLVLINCNVHQAMQANVMVLETPYFTHPDKDGQFRLDGVPPGPGKLMVWNPRAAVQTLRTTVPSLTPIAVQFALVKPRVQRHLNKENRAY